VNRGARVGGIVSIADAFPTLIDVLGVDPAVYEPRRDPRNSVLTATMKTDRSFAASLRGHVLSDRDAYAETDMPISYHWSPLRALLTREWKYIRAPRRELYDRVADPGDQTNLWASSARTADAMEQRLAAVEKAMESGVGAEVKLSAAERRRLASLGYMAGGGPRGPSAVRVDLPDMKDMIPVLDLQRHVSSAMRAGQRTPRTLEQCEELIALSPGSGVFHSWRGVILAALGRTQEALVSFADALRISPDEFTSRNNMAMVLVEVGRMDDAIHQFEEALRLNPTDTTIKYNLAIACNTRALELGKAGEFGKAAALLEEAVRLQPRYAQAHHNLGVALMGMGEVRRAVKAFRQALRLDPGHDFARIMLQRALAQSGGRSTTRSAQ
jgi:tetratricopeptide (TPR) repeat protein